MHAFQCEIHRKTVFNSEHVHLKGEHTEPGGMVLELCHMLIFPKYL